MIPDTTKFKSIGPASRFDFTASIESAFQRRLKRLLDDKVISLKVYEAIRPTGSQRPLLYGLPKTHKQGIPLRPILSMVNSPQHPLAKWCTDLLQPVLLKFSKHTVTDSFEFATLIRESRPPSTGCFMCSYDVKSLFTNVPLRETLNICVEQLYNTEIKPPSIPQEVCLELLEKATTNVQVSFNSTMFTQIDGVAMGSPLGPYWPTFLLGTTKNNSSSPPKSLSFTSGMLMTPSCCSTVRRNPIPFCSGCQTFILPWSLRWKRKKAWSCPFWMFLLSVDVATSLPRCIASQRSVDNIYTGTPSLQLNARLTSFRVW